MFTIAGGIILAIVIIFGFLMAVGAVFSAIESFKARKYRNQPPVKFGKIEPPDPRRDPPSHW